MWLLLALVLAVPAATSLYHAVRVDGPAPPFRLASTGYEGGQAGPRVAFGLEDYRGKTLVLDLMAVSCTACRRVTEEVLKPLQDAHGARPDFAILSVDTWADPAVAGDPALGYAGGESEADLVALQKESGVAWRHALDTDGVWRKYSAVTLPRIVVIDAAGRIVLDHLGAPSHAQVERAVQQSLAGQATPVPVLRLGLAGLAVVAGAVAVFTPCTVGLLPAYLALLLRPAQAAAPAPARRVLLGGVAAAAGIVTVYGALAVAFALAGAALRPWLSQAGPVVGAAMVAAGLATLWGKGVGGAGRLAGRLGGRRGFYLFGLAFALAGFGCTGPLFLPLLLAGFGQGTGAGILVFLLYAGAVTLLVLAAAAAVAAGLEGRLRGALRHARTVQAAAGALMAGAGAYLVWYFLAVP
ncbi:MAG TPA: cytochrome c biogenesis protein CcdA [Candidatus Thermoplasmatota archaeon]|nr:cytochrome c biogenesis protein CcdA [Candidatus Thermoplasmatota archaeon]